MQTIPSLHPPHYSLHPADHATVRSHHVGGVGVVVVWWWCGGGVVVVVHVYYLPSEKKHK